MAVTKTWNIEQMDRNASDGLVTVVHWRANATETVGEHTYYSNVYGSLSLTRGDTFIAFDSLTEEIVVDWVKNTLGTEQVTDYENSLIDQIESQKNPVTLTGKPW